VPPTLGRAPPFPPPLLFLLLLLVITPIHFHRVPRHRTPHHRHPPGLLLPCACPPQTLSPCPCSHPCPCAYPCPCHCQGVPGVSPPRDTAGNHVRTGAGTPGNGHGASWPPPPSPPLDTGTPGRPWSPPPSGGWGSSCSASQEGSEQRPPSEGRGSGPRRGQLVAPRGPRGFPGPAGPAPGVPWVVPGPPGGRRRRRRRGLRRRLWRSRQP